MKRCLASAIGIACALAALRSGVSAGAAEMPAPETVLTNFAQVTGLALETARQRPYFARLRGVVTYQPPETTSWLFLQEGDHAVQVFIGTNPRRFQPGQWIEVAGSIDPTTFAITIKRASVRELGQRDPPVPLPASPFDLQSGRHHARKVSLRGAVLDVALGEERPVLLMSSLGVTYNVFLAERRTTIPLEWWNGTLDVEGVVVSRTDLSGQASGFYLVAASNSWIRVVRPGTTNFAELPLRTARSLLEQKQLNDERVRVSGVVTHVSPRGWFTIEDATGPIGLSKLVPLPIHDRRHLHIARTGPAWPAPGDRVEAVGSLIRVRPYSPFLDYAEFRVVGRAPIPPPLAASAEEVATGRFDARVVTVKGEVIDRETATAGGLVANTLWLRAGETLFRASLYSTNATPHVAEPGDLVKVSGLCALVAGDAPRVRGFTIFPPGSEAIVRLGRGPGWFSPAVLQVGIAGLILIGGVLLWVRLLRGQVNARTADLARTNRVLQSEVEERKRADKVQRATYEISEAVHTAEDLNRFYRRVHEIVGGLMPAENFFLLLHDPVSDLYEYAYHMDRVDPWPKPRKVSGGLVGYILRTGRALLADRDSMTNPANEWHFVSGTPSAVWLGVPLMARGKAIGVMAVQDYQNPRAYGEEEKQILTYVAEQTALMIERKRAEAAIAESEARLRQSEQLFRTAFRSNPAVMALTRLEDGKFLAVNDAFLKATGYSEAEVIGSLARDLNLYADPAHRLEFVSLLKRDGCVFNRELQMRNKGGELFTMLVSGEVIEIHGEPHTLTVGLDISDRKKAEQDILRALSAERELGELKSRFVSMVSHEFRTPLGITMSAIELLRNHLDLLDDAKRKELFDDIFSSTRHMAGLMEQVLLLGRVEAGKLGFRPAPMDLETVCLKLVDESLSATNRQCPIETRIQDSLREARVDESLLRHIFSNLLSNAVKYSAPGAPVEFTIHRDGIDAVFRVRDRGIGIPESDLPKLFQAFHRAANVGETPGTGLGLVIVKRCVELHGGSIEVQSTPGHGSLFIVRLPVWSHLPS